jgi:hypothetical protein
VAVEGALGFDMHIEQIKGLARTPDTDARG